MSQVKYKRIILKVSGEALAGEKGTGINPEVIKHLAEEIKSVHDLGVEIGIVCGGGNMWRGETGANLGMERAQADYMGMLATIMNGLALQDGLEINADVILMAKNGVDGVYSADPKVDPNAKKYSELTQLDLISKNLKVMDSTASSLSMDNDIPLVVFNVNKPGNIKKVVMGENIGTVIKGDK